MSRRSLFPMAAALAASAALARQAKAEPVLDAPGSTLEPGRHRVDNNMTIKGDLLVKPGATIEIAAGRTLRLLGGLIAPIAPIFSGPGNVDLNQSRIAHAHPEWWGAVSGDGLADSSPALQACLTAHPVMHLLAADYFISRTLVVERHFCRIRGAGFRGTQAEQGTRVILTNGTDDVMRVGPVSAPPTVNDFLQNVDIRQLALCRSALVDISGGVAPAGLRAQFLLFAHIEEVSAFEHAVGFSVTGLVRSTLRDCVAFRSLSGRQPEQVFRGFMLNGFVDIGLAGGNASLFLENCNATIGGDPKIVDPVGLLLHGAFADTFVLNFEATALETGVRVDGATKALGERARNGHVNLHLRMPIIDQCGRRGIEIRDTSDHAQIDIADLYIASGPRTEAAVWLEEARGAISLSGGQLVGNTNAAAGGSAIGLRASASSGIQVTGLKILNHDAPVEMIGCAIFALQLLVANPGSRPGGNGVLLRDCRDGQADILLSGVNNAFDAGIQIEGSADALRIQATGIAPETVGGSAKRVLRGGQSMPVSVPVRDTGVVVEGA